MNQQDCPRRKSSNLKLIQIIHQLRMQDIRILDPNVSKSTKTRLDVKGYPKGKKIDNKTTKIKKSKGRESQELFNHIIQMTNHGFNTESVSNIQTLPFRQKSRHAMSRNDHSDATHSICTFDLNEQTQKERRLTHNYRRSDYKIEYNKENSRSQSRNSLGLDRGKDHIRKVHNRSCNDIEYKVASRKCSRDFKKANLSCTEEKTSSASPDRRKRTPKKTRKSVPSIIKNPTVKHINYKKPTVQNFRNQKKTIDSRLPKKKELRPAKPSKQSGQPKQPKSLKNPKEPRRPSANLDQGEQIVEDSEYPVSKYISHVRRSKQISETVTIQHSICEHIFSSNSSLIPSIGQSKKWAQQEINYQMGTLEIVGESSLNLKQIRGFQQINLKSRESLMRQRRRLHKSISIQYPQLEQSELQFLASVVFIQREWRRVLNRRSQVVPDQNLTFIIKDILQKAIKSQQVSPNVQLAETTKFNKNPQHQKKKFFTQEDRSNGIAPASSLKDIGSPVQSSSLMFGDLVIPESRIRQISLEGDFILPRSEVLRNQKFPPFELIQQHRFQLLEKFTSKMNELEHHQPTISKDLRSEIKQKMKRQLHQLNSQTRSMQRGYLCYLNCLRSIKTTPKSKTLLRKVSSSQGLMFDLYKKAFSMQDFITESESVQSLAKKVLIRRQWYSKESFVYYGPDQTSPINLTLKDDSGSKRRLEDFMLGSVENIRKRQQSSNAVSLNSLLQQVRRQVSQNNSEEYESEIMFGLLREGFGQEDQSKVAQIVDMVLETLYLEFAQDADSSKKVKKQLGEILMRRHLPGIDCSDQAIQYYLVLVQEELINNHQPQLLQSLNTTLGFSSLSILKLMRQSNYSPPEGYTSPVDPKVFQAVQKAYLDRIDLQDTYKSFTQVVQSLINVHNKAVYECFISQIQMLKPNGESGRVHLWDPPQLQKISPITEQNLESQLLQAVRKVLGYCSVKSGLILQNWVTKNGKQLQKAYEQNQERIVSMISSDLVQEQFHWSNVHEFLLQVKLDTEMMVLQWLMTEAAQEIAGIKHP